MPLHKKTFELGSGESTQGEDYSIKVFDVQLFLHSSEKLDPILAAGSFCGTACKATIDELVTLGHLPEIRPSDTMESCSYRQITESRGNFCAVVGLLAT